MRRKGESVTLDANKLPLTHRVTALAAAYLNNLGCKPVETEVPIRPGWIADVASYWYPTQTEVKKLGLNKNVAALYEGNPSDYRKVMDWVVGEGLLTVVAEVKVSRSDFAADARKWTTDVSPANLCFLAYPTGVVEALPRGWYGIETTKDGSRIQKIHRAYTRFHAQFSAQQLDLVAAVGIRRDHRTRHRAVSDWLKAYRVEDRTKQAQYSAADLLHGLAEWVQGEGWRADRSLRDVLSKLGLKKVPAYAREAVAYFETLREEGKEKV